MSRPYSRKQDYFAVLDKFKGKKNLKFKDVKASLRVVAGKTIHRLTKPNKKDFSYQIFHKKKLNMIRRELQNILNTDEVRMFLTRFNNI
jgi:hypothetical protein